MSEGEEKLLGVSVVERREENTATVWRIGRGEVVSTDFGRPGTDTRWLRLHLTVQTLFVTIQQFPCHMEHQMVEDKRVVKVP